MNNGRFGIHGGQYIPETLMNAVIELEEAYNHYKNDPDFNRELTTLLNEYAGDIDDNDLVFSHGRSQLPGVSNGVGALDGGNDALQS